MFIDGSYSVLYIKHDGVFLPIGCLTSNSFSEETESLDSTTRDNNGWKTNRLTNQSYNISFEGIDIGDYTSTTLFTLHRLTEIKRNRQLVEWKIQGKDENYEYGVGFITSLSNDSSVDELSSFSGEIVGYGSPYDYLEKIIKDYENRIIADGGTIEALDCLRKSIEEIINKEKKPKLALIPSGYGVDKVYSVLPSDGVGDFDFSRSGSATRINKDGLIETVGSNIPRLNYPLIDGVVSGCPSLLLEPQETQLISYSNDFSNSDWQKYGVNLYYNSAIGVDGTLSATTLSRAAGTPNRINQNKLLVAGNQYTISIYAKADSDKYITIGLVYGASNYSAVQFDLVNGIVLNSYSAGAFSVYSPKIEKMPNNWYRVSATVLPGINDSYPAFIASNTLWTSGSPGVFDPGNGVSGIYIQKPMFTNSTVLTSYIENTSAGTVTRSAETCNNAGDANTFNDSEGVLMAEISALANDQTNRLISLTNGSSSERISLFYSQDSSNEVKGIVFVGGSAVGEVEYNSIDITTNLKVALKYKANDLSLWINGIEVVTDNLSSTPTGLDRLNFDLGISSSVLPFYGNTKQIQYFDTALTDEELEQISSWTSFNEMAQAQLYTII